LLAAPLCQRYFEDYSLDFSIRKKSEAADDALELVWLSKKQPIDDDAILMLNTELEKAKKKEAKFRQLLSSYDIPSWESDTIFYYLSSYMKALELTLQEAANFRDPDESNYSLQEETVVINNIDSFYFPIYQCNTLLQNYFDEAFDEVETLKSAYQEIEFLKDPVKNDVCLYLDGVYQQCMVRNFNSWIHH
jgi:hypothetical protein